MTDQHDPTAVADTVSRRRLLRVAGAGAGGLVLGAAGTAERAAATRCPRPPAYWADNDWPESDRVADPLEIAGESKRIALWKLFLAMDPADDAGATMARQVLAARLNFQWRPSEDPDCVHAALPGDGDGSIATTKGRATEWLAASAWPDVQRGWVVDGVDGEPLWAALRAFNHRGFAELDCGCPATGDGEQVPYPVPSTAGSGRASGRQGLVDEGRFVVEDGRQRPFRR